ncbi:MAG: hypothetical protein FP816_01255 [Desulfobacteraceae bacterium]|nr:hypothetical protein [Desulfobacteraceae bacterium]
MAPEGSTKNFRIESLRVSAATQLALNVKAEKGTHYPYALNIQDVGQADIDGLTITFASAGPMGVVFDSATYTLESFTHTFTQGQNYFVWVNPDGTILYDEADEGNFDRYDLKCPLYKVLTWPVGSENTGIWAVWKMADTIPVRNTVWKVPVNLDLLLNDYWVFPHNKEWGAQTLEYRDCVRTSARRLYLCTVPGTISITEPLAPALVWEPYSYENWGDFQATDGTAMLRYIGMDFCEGAFRQGLIAGVHNVFGLETAGFLARCPREISDPLAPMLYAYLKQAINSAVTVRFNNHTYEYGMHVTGDYNYEGWVYRCIAPGVTDSSCPFSIDPAPTPGTTTVEDGGVTWLCVGRTSYHNPDVNWTIMDLDILGVLLTKPDSHDASIWGLMFLANQLREAGNLPDEFFYGYSKHRDLYNNPKTYFSTFNDFIYCNLTTQFNGNLYWGSQFGLQPDGSGDLYPYYLFMDICSGWGAHDQAIKIYSDPRGNKSAADIAYYTAWRDAIKGGIERFWVEEAGAFTWVLDDTGAQMETYFPPDPEDSPPAYPWVMSQFTPMSFGVPIGYPKMQRAHAYADKIFPNWWKRNQEGSPFLAHFGALAMCMVDGSNTLRDEIIDLIEKDRMDVFSPDDPTSYGLQNIKMLHGLAIYLLLKTSPILKPFNVNTFDGTDGHQSVDVSVAVFTGVCSSGDGAAYYMVPVNLDEYCLEDVFMSCAVPGTTGVMSLQINRRRLPVGGSAEFVDMLTTLFSVDSGEYDSRNAATRGVINPDISDVRAYDLLRLDIVDVHTTPAQWLVVGLRFRK